MTALRVRTWNIGSCPNKAESELLINYNQLEVILISKARCTDKSKINIKGCNIYTINHPDGTTKAGTAIVVRNSTKCSQNFG